MIYANKLRTHYVSHEESYEPTNEDGDFMEPFILLICCFDEGKKIKRGSLINSFEPRMAVGKSFVVAVK
jgi:hypothetical protein